ncbi:MAG: tRNA (adenosine(37)-N6)-threonylcarbamoyltransferase complex dimerization subunit type 1 TsaB [Alphaproteobacteria bacterium]|nr:tRNA (adenosine(37)-N6)-threonylcarbamoyltransferase complex dimerization subunit type 1 TsaB [Alphaproteobacteria bacterium]
MIVLGLDTAQGACSAALLKDGHILARRHAAMRTGHAEALAPMVEAVLREADRVPASIDRIAVTIGPGTFTGLRVALALTRGMALALRCEIVGIGTLEAMAEAVRQEGEGGGLIIVAIDARRDELYFQIFSRDGVPCAPPALLSIEAAAAEVTRWSKEAEGPLRVAGSGFPLLAARKEAWTSRLCDTGRNEPDAVCVARLGAAKAPGAEAPKPLYLRKPDAKLPAKSMAMGAARIRRGLPADAMLVAALQNASFEEQWNAAAVAQFLDGPGTALILAENGMGECEGYALLRQTGAEAEIISLAVAPDSRRRGIGRILMEGVLAALREAGANALFLEVSVVNEAALTLYQGLGFVPVGRRAAYYRDRFGAHDALVLKRDLVQNET